MEKRNADFGNIVIRNYKDPDYAAVRRILSEGGLFYSQWDSRASLRRKIRIFPGSVLVAVKDGKVVGCLYVLLEIGGSFVQLAVKKEFRKHGIAAELMAHGEGFLKRKGISEALLWADSENAELQRYYQKKGYLPGKTYRFFTKNLKTQHYSKL